MAGAPQATAYVSFVQPVTHETVSALLHVCNEFIGQSIQELHLLISSGGGQLIPGFGAYNQLLGLPVQLVTHNIGSVNSIANIVFLAGKHRLAAPSATFLFHGTMWGFPNAAEITRRQLAEIAASLDADEARMRRIFVARSGLSEAEIGQLIAEGSTKDAVFAQQMGIIHEIADVAIAPGSVVRQI